MDTFIFSSNQLYDWGRFSNTGWDTRTKITASYLEAKIRLTNWFTIRLRTGPSSCSRTRSRAGAMETITGVTGVVSYVTRYGYLLRHGTIHRRRQESAYCHKNRYHQQHYKHQNKFSTYDIKSDLFWFERVKKRNLYTCIMEAKI